VSEAVSQGIRVSVRTSYIPEQSVPREHRYVFAYSIRIANEGSRTAQLLNRHWIITHGTGHVEEVKGPGVVGAQPRLEPGQAFEYTSGCVLSTPHGTMHGTYEMKRDDGSLFNATIAPFSLSMPYALN
jgi:ApaG protein